MHQPHSSSSTVARSCFACQEMFLEPAPAARLAVRCALAHLPLPSWSGPSRKPRLRAKHTAATSGWWARREKTKKIPTGNEAERHAWARYLEAAGPWTSSWGWFIGDRFLGRRQGFCATDACPERASAGWAFPPAGHPVHVPRLRVASRRRAHRGRTEVGTHRLSETAGTATAASGDTPKAGSTPTQFTREATPSTGAPACACGSFCGDAGVCNPLSDQHCQDNSGRVFKPGFRRSDHKHCTRLRGPAVAVVVVVVLVVLVVCVTG